MKTYTITLRKNDEEKKVFGYNLSHALAMNGMKLKDIKSWTI